MDTVLIGLLGGLITGISPCILPVLPVIFLTAGAQSARVGETPEVIPAPRSRPYFVIAGLVLSFTAVTLAGSIILGFFSLPQAAIRWAGVAVLVLIGVGMLFPRVEQILERPFQWLPRRKVDDGGNGFGMGLALGAVFVPCAGPVLAAIIVAGSTGTIGAGTIALTVSFAIGVALPLLAFALAGRGLTERIRAFRKRERAIRITAAAALLALAAGLAFNLPQAIQRLIPDYTAGLQQELAGSEGARRALDLGGLVTDENRELDQCSNGAAELESCGTAPDIRGIEAWLNTPAGAAVDLAQLRGEVVLIDFWAYSCINCQRSIPHVVAWDRAYRDAGLRVIGVHSPEYAFEKDAQNVADAARGFGIEYPVALDNNLSTWTAYRNRYWPAHYLIDAQGTVRHISFGEGNYDSTERMIRQLLKDADPTVKLPDTTDTKDTTPQVGTTTPETFLGYAKDVNFAGPGDYGAGVNEFTLPQEQPQDSFALDGSWRVESQYATPAGPAGLADPATPGDTAAIRLNYRASEVRMVVAGEGSLRVTDAAGERTVKVSGTPRSYALLGKDSPPAGTLEVQVPVGVEVYSFTFG
ncbi:cytochrome c biogenesis protein DipZ [Leucobacter sp. HY1908]